MKIILRAHDKADKADLIEMASVAACALDNGIADKKTGETMIVTIGQDYRRSFGVIRRHGGITVYPPSDRS